MNNLLIFTKLFPYAKTEAFLESEIAILSRHFNKIIIYPAYKDSYVRDLPPNVSIDNTFLINKKRRTICLISIFFNGKILKYLLDNRKQSYSISSIKNLIRYASYELYYNYVYQKNKLQWDESTIVYSYWFSYIVNSLLSVKKSNNHNFKIITRAHRWDIYEEKGSTFPYRQKNINELTALYPISQDGKNYLSERYGNISKIKVARLGVFDSDFIAKSSSENVLTIVSVAQISKRKRIILLFESLKEYALHNKNIKIKWIHFGIGPLKEELEKRVHENSISNLIIDLKGYVSNIDIYKFYKEEPTDIFINLSESEGVPVSIMEAQSFGIAVIATNVGGTSEIVNNKVGVLLSSNPKIEDVCSAIDSVTKNSIKKETIKNEWEKMSNAEINFTEFANELLNL